MNSTVILFDLQSGNAVSDFASERNAWAALLAMAETDGLAALVDLSLMQMRDGQPTVIAMEDAVVQRVARDLGQATAAPRAQPMRIASSLNERKLA